MTNSSRLSKQSGSNKQATRMTTGPAFKVRVHATIHSVSPLLVRAISHDLCFIVAVPQDAIIRQCMGMVSSLLYPTRRTCAPATMNIECLSNIAGISGKEDRILVSKGVVFLRPGCCACSYWTWTEPSGQISRTMPGTHCWLVFENLTSELYSEAAPYSRGDRARSRGDWNPTAT